MTDLVAIQITSTPSIERNLALIENQLRQLTDKQQLVVLPECFAFFGGLDKRQVDIAETAGNGPIQSALSALAKRYNKWIVAGTVPIKPSKNNTVRSVKEKYYAASLVYDNNGLLVSRYDKIHLFDVSVNDNTGHYKESATTLPGQNVIFFESPWGTVGQIVCYDLRFPELIQKMPQLDVLVVPSAFTRRTGEAHWHALLQARSIENQCYVVASDQTGVHHNGRETYGNSCIYSPWGELLANLPANEGWVAAKYDKTLLANIRKEMPIQQHKHNRKPF
ncbi:MAG: putative amidohydrolase [Gammaproteobacteria bacterium]|jgi:predicted amidohydrolase